MYKASLYCEHVFRVNCRLKNRTIAGQIGNSVLSSVEMETNLNSCVRANTKLKLKSEEKHKGQGELKTG